MSNKSENGRYGIEYTKTFYLSYPLLYVSITQLRKSDSGWYRCGLGSPLSSDSHEDFEIIVKDAPTTSKPKWTLRPSSATVPSTSTATTTLSFTASSVSHEADPAPTTSKPNWTLQPSSSSAPSTSTTTTTTTQSLSSSSESFTASSVSSKTTKKFEQRPALAASADPEKLLYVVLFLVLALFLFSLVLLLFGRRRTKKPKESRLERYTSISEDNREREDLREDRQSRSLEMSAVHTQAEPRGGWTAPQHRAADDGSKLAHPEEDFPSCTAALLVKNSGVDKPAL